MYFTLVGASEDHLDYLACVAYTPFSGRRHFTQPSGNLDLAAQTESYLPLRFCLNPSMGAALQGPLLSAECVRVDGNGRENGVLMTGWVRSIVHF